MIRGYIEQVTQDVVSGWIFSEAIPVRDRRVMAMLGEEVVGAGRVEHFRQDLADAGLGDGFLGFHFRVRPLAEPEIQRVAVRLEGGDMVLQQPPNRYAAAAAGAPAAAGGAGGASDADLPSLPEPCLRWMQAQGWLTALECDAIRLLGRFGVYAHELADGRPGAGGVPAAAAATFFERYAMREVIVASQELGSIDDLAGALRDTEGEAATPAGKARPLPVYALWCPVPGRLGVAEGSHEDGAAGTGRDALTDYAYGPEQLLVLHRRCRFVPRPRPQEGRLTLVTGHMPPPRRGGRQAGG